jgi:hypothetical protein
MAAPDATAPSLAGHTASAAFPVSPRRAEPVFGIDTALKEANRQANKGEEAMSLEIIGAGIGRTGTLSLKMALEHLGFGPCHHMAEVFKNVQTQVPLWQAACAGKPDWDRTFTGYRSAVDFPAAAFYKELADYYPDAKVILTVRDSTAVWVKSMMATISAALRGEVKDEFQAWKEMATSAINDRFFGGGMDDKDRLAARYERHNEEVQRNIPARRLLVYNVTQGWQPLCAFLNVPVPAEPFPQTNSTQFFNETIVPIFGRSAPG